MSRDRDMTPEEAQRMAEACCAALTCDGCARCRLICPDLAITQDAAGGVVINAAFCRGCGLCVAVCPCGALAMAPLR